MRNADSISDARGLLGGSASRMVGLVLLLSVGALLESVKLSSLRDPEIWGHLRAGNWILENRKWPELGLFSQAANLTWRDFSWAYDVLAAGACHLMSLRAVPALLICFRVAIAAVTFLVAGGQRNFWSAVGLSAVAQYLLAGMGPEATCLSLVFFGIELLLLLEVRRLGNLRPLYALPIVFFFWTNLDIGFLYGIALYLLFLVVLALERVFRLESWMEKQKQGRNPIGAAALTGAACMGASFLNPYGYHAYGVFLATQFSPVNNYLPAYTSMTFRQPQDYVLLLLTMAAFLWLGLRQTRDLFQIAVLVACAALAFHAQRDNWLVILAAVAVIGQCMLQGGPRSSALERQYWVRRSLTALARTVVLVCIVFALVVPRGRPALLAKIAHYFPVHACEFIRQHQLPKPLFNSYGWGSFLTWYLPEYPVAIDGRRGLYPEDEEINYFKAMKADIPYQEFPPMKLARTLLLDKTGVMGDALRGVPGFQVVYEDDISIVLLQAPKE